MEPTVTGNSPYYNSVNFTWILDDSMPYTVADSIVVNVVEADTDNVISSGNTFNPTTGMGTISGLNQGTKYVLMVATSNPYGTSEFINSTFVTGVQPFLNNYIIL